MGSTPTGGLPPFSCGEKCARLTHEARAKHIIETAIRLFAQKGFQGTKTKEIAEAAGINEALIFRDFHNKEKLYCAILDYALCRLGVERWIEELAPYAEQRNDDALFSSLAMKIFESFGREPLLFRLMLYSALEQHELARKFRERHGEALERFIEGYMRTRQAEGGFREIDPHSVARNFLSMCHQHVLRQVLFGTGGGEPADAAAAKTITEVLLEGVRSH